MNLSGMGTNRRGFLRTGAALGGTAVAAGMLTSCGDDQSPGGQPGGGTPKKGGTLSLALYGAAQSDTTDSQHGLSVWDLAIGFQLYNSPLAKAPIDGDPKNGLEAVPGLAESVEFDGPQKVVIKLREGAEFHHGKTVTAEDVLFSFRRIVDPSAPGAAAPFLTTVDLKASKAVDDTTLQLVLTKPDYFLPSALANIYSRVYPTDWDAENPVGTGPWKLKDWQPGKSISFERFENYWDTPAYADELVFQGYDDTTALTNALTSGAVNLLANVPASQIKLLENDSRFTVVSSPAGAAFATFAMRKQTAPFTDQRVREAFRLMIDRQAMADQLYGGRATIGNDLFNPFDPAYNSDLPQREHDPDKAKSLLDEAGVSPLELTLATGGFTPNSEVVYSQAAKDADVTLEVKKVDQSTFYSQHYGQDPIFSTAWTATSTVPQIIGLSSLASSPFNETQENDERIASLYEQAQGTEDEAQRIDLVKQIQEIQWNDGGYIIPVLPDQIDAASVNVQGIQTDVSGQSFAQFNAKAMWLA